jgi:hypothetical protein
MTYKKPREEELKQWEKAGYNETLPSHLIWVCAACGKTSPTRSGFDSNKKRVSDHGWDESCFLNAVLCKKDSE